MTATTYREGCGTHLGLRLHQAKGEPACARCLRGEDIRRVLREGIPTRPSPVYTPITPEQAARNRAELARALRSQP